MARALCMDVALINGWRSVCGLTNGLCNMRWMCMNMQASACGWRTAITYDIMFCALGMHQSDSRYFVLVTVARAMWLCMHESMPMLSAVGINTVFFHWHGRDSVLWGVFCCLARARFSHAAKTGAPLWISVLFLWGTPTAVAWVCQFCLFFLWKYWLYTMGEEKWWKKIDGSAMKSGDYFLHNAPTVSCF